MKQLFLALGLLTGLFSCQKEITQKSTQPEKANVFAIQTVLSNLKDSLSLNDFESLDTNRWYKSFDVNKNAYLVRISFLGKDLESDFILLKLDSSTGIKEGKIIHVEKKTPLGPNALFNGQVTITSLNKKQSITRIVKNGRWQEKKMLAPAASIMEEDPAGEQDLPDVVVTSYTYNGSTLGDWYLLDAFFSGGSSSSNEGSNGYLYSYSSGGGSVSNSENTIVIEHEANDDGGIRVKDYLECFDNVPNSGASYSITLYTDIPVDDDPSKIFNWNTLSPGHTFIQLNKTSGSITVQQILGFYPAISFKSLGKYPTQSKIVDNAAHEYNASITQTLSGTQFQAILNKIEFEQNMDYDMAHWNCTDFALSIFNASSYNPLTIPQYKTEGSGEWMNTPQGLYTEIQLLKASGNTSHGTPNVTVPEAHAGKSHGSCEM